MGVLPARRQVGLQLLHLGVQLVLGAIDRVQVPGVDAIAIAVV